MLPLILSFLYKRIISQIISVVALTLRTLYWCFCTVFIAKFACLLWLSSGSALANSQIECLIDAKIGFTDPKNIYQCKLPLKCCFEYNLPSCCGSKPSFQIIKEQLTLWGGLFGILITIASIVYCRKNDITIPGCGLIRDCFVKCCCGGGGGDSDDNERGQDISLDVSRQNSTMWNNNSSSNKLSNGKLVVSDNGNSNNNNNNVRHGWRKNTVNPIDSELQINRITNV